MSSVEFALHVAGLEDLEGTSVKPRLPIAPDTYLKRCAVVSVTGARLDVNTILQRFDPNLRAIIIELTGRDEESMQDTSVAVRALRQLEKDRRAPLFITLSLLHAGNISSDSFAAMCRLAYMSGVDGILIRGDVSPSDVSEVREKALGLRGRRIKIILNDVSRFTESVKVADGIIATGEMDSTDARSILSRMKLLLTRSVTKTDLLKADALIVSLEEGATPATTEPSSPVISQVTPQTSSLPRNFLLNEVRKFLSPGSRLIIALSEDGDSVRELSVQFRLSSTHRITPPILGLSASESTCRYMGLFYGVIPLQTQSFVSVNTVVMNAIEFAKDQGMVQPGDEVVVVTQPPPVTASTNEMCFEGVVQKRTVS